MGSIAHSPIPMNYPIPFGIEHGANREMAQASPSERDQRAVTNPTEPNWTTDYPGTNHGRVT